MKGIAEGPIDEIKEMIVHLNKFMLPTSLMESFDAFREDCLQTAAQNFNQAQLAWFLEMLNRFRGSEDRKDALLDIFDPGLYTSDHPAWEAPPGTRIEMPALTSDVAKMAKNDSEFMEIAVEEIREFREHAETYTNEELKGLARIAAAGLVDLKRTFGEREDAIRYLALNSSALLEDLWAYDDALWENAPRRVIEFEDMVAKRKTALLKANLESQIFTEEDFACYSEDEVRKFAFDIRSLFLLDRAKHLAICSRCQTRLEFWTRLVEKFDQAMPTARGRADA